MAEELNAGEKLNRELAAKPGHEDLLRLEQRLGGRMEGLEGRMGKMEAKIDQLLQAMQNFSGRMEGRMDEISRQLAAKR